MKATNLITLITKYLMAGYTPQHTVSGKVQHPDKVECPECLKRFSEYTDTPMPLSYTTAVVFEKEGKPTVIACPCGYREKVDIVPLCPCGNPLPEGRKMFCYDCRPLKR